MKRTILLLTFILAKFLLQYLLYNSNYDLHRDEYLHLDQANHLAWGYSSVPPLTSWLSYLIKILGNSIFWIKFFPALFGALTLFFVWKSIEALKGNIFALILGATCILFSSLVRINLLYQPNSLDILCWTAFYFAIIKYFTNCNPKWLYSASVIFAIGFLNKYNIVFSILGLIPALLFTKQRVILSRAHTYYAAVLFFLCISPNLYWQYVNGFPVFKHLRELSATQLIYVDRLLFFKEQIFYQIGALPVIAAALYALHIYPAFDKYRFLVLAFVFTLGTFAFFKAKGYYALGVYPMYIAFGAVYLDDILNNGWKKKIRMVFLGLPVLFYFLLYKVFYTVEDPGRIMKAQEEYSRLGLLRWEDGKEHHLPQDFADMLGWKELATKVEAVYLDLPVETCTLILCDNYGQAGAINYYVKNKQIRAVAFSADYITWFNLDQNINNLIRVKERVGSDDELGQTGPLFHKSAIAGHVSNVLAREYKTTIFVFKDAEVDVNARLRAEIKAAKE